MKIKPRLYQIPARWAAAGLICLFLTVPAVIRAGEAMSDLDPDLTFSPGKIWQLSAMPGGNIYPGYIADPLRPCFAIQKINVSDSGIPDAGESRYAFTLGGRYGLLRFFPDDDSGRALQLDIYAAFMGQFDLDNGADNIGWDGLYGAILSWTNGSGLALKLAMAHDSSHVGDEYIERTGRERISYTREEWVAGVSYRFLDIFRLYGEGAYAYDLRNEELQEPARIQAGFEIEDPHRFLGGRLGYYGALDVGAYEESDWDADVSLQAGVVLPTDRFMRSIRIGLMYRNGRSPIGEFFRHSETWWGMGLWIDF